MSKISDTIGKVGGFVTHYGNELLSVSSLIGGILQHLPIDQGDKDHFGSVLNDLEEAAQRAIDGAGAIEGDIAQRVVVKKSDVDAAVAAFLSSAAGKAIIADAVKGTANAKNS